MAATELNGIFINLEVDESVARDPELAAKLEEVCPVDIFATDDDGTLGSSTRTSTSACSATCAWTRPRRGPSA